MGIILHPVCRINTAHKAGIENYHVELFRRSFILRRTGVQDIGEVVRIQSVKAEVFIKANALCSIGSMIPYDKHISLCRIFFPAPAHKIHKGFRIAHALIFQLVHKLQRVILCNNIKKECHIDFSKGALFKAA